MRTLKNKFRPRSLISATMIAMLVATNAQAAVLTSFTGTVMVNSGNGFQPASIGSSLAPGDRVRTGEGSANIRYDNGCTTTVGPHQFTVVYWQPPLCHVGGLKDGASTTPVEPASDENSLLAGGLVAGAAVGIAVAIATTNNQPSPASP